MGILSINLWPCGEGVGMHPRKGGGFSPPFFNSKTKVSDIDRPSKNRLKRRFEAHYFAGFAVLAQMLSGKGKPEISEKC